MFFVLNITFTPNIASLRLYASFINQSLPRSIQQSNNRRLTYKTE